jgi:hypothetical protein
MGLLGRIWTRPIAVMAAVGLAVTYVAEVSPDQPGHYPTCPFLYVTGYYCPGCGTLRMIHALAHGHPRAGLGFNPLVLCTLPFLGYLWVRWVRAAARGERMKSRLLRAPVLGTYLVLVVAFWIIRNLPAGRALAP